MLTPPLPFCLLFLMENRYPAMGKFHAVHARKTTSPRTPPPLKNMLPSGEEKQWQNSLEAFNKLWRKKCYSMKFLKICRHFLDVRSRHRIVFQTHYGFLCRLKWTGQYCAIVSYPELLIFFAINVNGNPRTYSVAAESNIYKVWEFSLSKSLFAQWDLFLSNKKICRKWGIFMGAWEETFFSKMRWKMIPPKVGDCATILSCGYS